MIFDAIVIGLGLSGSASAISLAQRGARVLALESGSFPRRKVCGEFLSFESRATLARLQVLEAVLEGGARDVCEMRIFAPHRSLRGRTPRALKAPLRAPGLAFSRWELDRILFERALEVGVQVETQARVSHIESCAQGWKVRVGEREFCCKYLLATAGRDAPWWEKEFEPSRAQDRFVGLKAHFANADLEDGVTELHAWRGGYCGLMRIEDGSVNACLLARYDSLGGRSPRDFWDELLAQVPLMRERMGRATLLQPWLATANVRFRPPTPLRRLAASASTSASTCGAQVMCAGDAAGFIHPLTGDGMAMALRGGELAAAAIAGALQNGWDEFDLRPLWRAAWEREFSARLKWSRALQAALIEPRLSRLARPLFSLAPGLAQLVVHKTRGKVQL